VNAALLPAAPATDLGSALVAHLDDQLTSTRRLLQIVVAQAAVIRDRDVDTVLAAITDVQSEMERRAGLERVRAQLLAHAGGALGVAAHVVTLDAICSLVHPTHALAARERSAELRGLLAEVGRQHQANRILMRQELAFLEHLTRLLGGEEHGGYAPPGAGAPMHPAASTPHRVLDLQA
jgi:flagellar FlgN protein